MFKKLYVMKSFFEHFHEKYYIVLFSLEAIVKIGKFYFSHKSVAIKMDTTWISKIGFQQIVSQNVGWQLKVIWQTRYLWNKKCISKNLNESNTTDFPGMTEFIKGVHHEVFNSVWSNLVGS